MTPHIGYRTTDAMRKMLWIAVDNLQSYATGAPQNVVTSPTKQCQPYDNDPVEQR